VHCHRLAVRAGHQGQHCRMPSEIDLILPIGHGRVKPERHVLGQHFRVQPPALQIGFHQGRFKKDRLGFENRVGLIKGSVSR